MISASVCRKIGADCMCLQYENLEMFFFFFKIGAWKWFKQQEMRLFFSHSYGSRGPKNRTIYLCQTTRGNIETICNYI